MFYELTIQQTQEIDGGVSAWSCVGAALGLASVCWAIPVAVAVSSVATGVAMVFVGAGAFGKGTGLY